MSRSLALLLVSLTACAAEPGEVVLPGASTLRELSTVDGQTWFLVTSQKGRNATICRLAELHLDCATVPNSATGVALVEAGAGATPLLALPSIEGTNYLEPFTWTLVRKLDNVAYYQHAVILDDGSLWISLPHNVLIVPRIGSPRHAFEANTTGASVTPQSVLWFHDRVVRTAPLEGSRLGPVRSHPALDMSRIERRSADDLCRVGTTIGVRQAEMQVAMFDLATDHLGRAYDGDRRRILCGPNYVTADFADHYFAHDRREQLGAARAVAIPTATLVMYLTGEVLVIDGADRRRTLELRWLGMPYGW